MNSIGIVGAGDLGSLLASRLSAVGHRVKIANSRGADTLVDVAGRTGAVAVDLADVAADTDVLILALPLGGMPALRAVLSSTVAADTVVVDATNYVPPRDGHIGPIDAGTPESAWVSDQLGLPVVKAFNSITDDSLLRGGRPVGDRDRIALPVCGDRAGDRFIIMRMIEELGFDAFDAGSLDGSWRQQIGQPAYCTDPSLDQLRLLLERADPETITKGRENAMSMMSRMPESFPKPDLVRAARFMAGIDRLRPATWVSLVRLMVAMIRRRN